MTTCIVIPVYKAFLDDYERLSLHRCMTTLADHEVVLCEPQHLDSSGLRKEYPHIRVEKFSDAFFTSILGYNRLMLSSEFYQRFANYAYILVYQLDAYVFKNDLQSWVAKGYDYIGAPWLDSPAGPLKRLRRALQSSRKQEREQIFFKVGNGGLSLRRVASFIEVLSNNQEAVSSQLATPDGHFRLMEDVFWSIEAPKLNPSFTIPGYEEAVYFAMDRRPKVGFDLTQGQLPFGCHGFNRKNTVSFWRQKIPELGR